MLAVSHPDIPARLLHELRDSRVMDVADAREQMVFDLKVQAAQEPRRRPAAAGKIHGRFDLMYRPCVFHSPGEGLRQRKLRLLHAVRQLKHDAKHQAEHEPLLWHKKRYDPNRMKQQRDPERDGEKTTLPAMNATRSRPFGRGNRCSPIRPESRPGSHRPDAT